MEELLFILWFLVELVFEGCVCLINEPRHALYLLLNLAVFCAVAFLAGLALTMIAQESVELQQSLWLRAGIPVGFGMLSLVPLNVFLRTQMRSHAAE